MPVFTEHSPYTKFARTKRGRVSAEELGRDLDETENTIRLRTRRVANFLNTLEGEYALFHETYIADLMYQEFGGDIGIRIRDLRMAMRFFLTEPGVFTSNTLELRRETCDPHAVNEHVQITVQYFGRHSADLWYTVENASYHYLEAKKQTKVLRAVERSQKKLMGHEKSEPVWRGQHKDSVVFALKGEWKRFCKTGSYASTSKEFKSELTAIIRKHAVMRMMRMMRMVIAMEVVTGLGTVVLKKRKKRNTPKISPSQNTCTPSSETRTTRTT